MAREVVVSVAAGPNLIAIELLSRQIAFTLDRIQITAMPDLIIILSLISFIVPQIL